MDAFCQQFEAAIPKLREQILAEFRKEHTQAGYRSFWEHFEEIIIPILKQFLKQPPFSIPDANIEEALKKSTYPDLKVLHRGNWYAIDVKSGEDAKRPAYDVGRLDTYEENHLDKYTGEFLVIVRWKGRKPPEVVNVYIEPRYQTIGCRRAPGGVYYRRYDGKLRPKSWAHFDRGEAYWNNSAQFKEGLIASRDFRRKSLTLEWYEAMNPSQRKIHQEDLRAIDNGKTVETDESLLEDDGTDSDR